MSINYSCTALVGSNKSGVLKPDADGYYTVVLGALNFFNSAGHYYPLEPAEKLFADSFFELGESATGYVFSLSAIKGGFCSFFHLGRGVKVWLACRKVNHVDAFGHHGLSFGIDGECH